MNTYMYGNGLHERAHCESDSTVLMTYDDFPVKTKPVITVSCYV